MFTPAPNILWELLWGTIFLGSLLFLFSYISVIIQAKEEEKEGDDFGGLGCMWVLVAILLVVVLWSGYKAFGGW